MGIFSRFKRRKTGSEITDSLPGCDDLFQKYFDRWYEEADRQNKTFQSNIPDIETCAPPGTKVENVTRFSEENREKIIIQVSKMVEAASKDWPNFLGESGHLDVDWIDAFDKHWDQARIANMLYTADPTDFSNPYLITCCEFGAAIGDVLLSLAPRCGWLADWPYWESAIYDPMSGKRINVFHWSIKKFSEYGVDDGFAAKLKACAAVINNNWKTPAHFDPN